MKKETRLKNKFRKGFTLAETIVVVAIIAILVAIGVVAVVKYRRGLHQLEMDGTAKEIFVAAQNHLTMAESQGYLGRTGFGTEETDGEGHGTGVYYFIVGAEGSYPDDSEGILSLMLPFAAVDETVRSGGSYIIRYSKSPALVMDVFYASKTGGFSHVFNGADSIEYDSLMFDPDYRGEEKKSDRRNYSEDDSVIGYFGGVEAQNIETVTIESPVLEIENADRLIARFTVPVSNAPGTEYKLVITGELSGARKAVPSSALSLEGGVYSYIIDSVVDGEQHFAGIDADTEAKFIPGENITVKAVAYNNNAYTNLGDSNTVLTNSLFATGSDTETAVISSIRHLENLGADISKIDDNDGENKLNITRAKQIRNLNWNDFKSNTRGDSTRINSAATGAVTEAGYYMPVKPLENRIDYDGQNNSITAVAVKSANHAGLFETLSNSKVTSLELVDFDIQATGEGSFAGALAGTVNGGGSGTEITYVLARGNSAKISSGGIAGGLVGQSSNSHIDASGAAVYVEANGAAGGLIGKTVDGTVNDCYSGGHTVNGKYDRDSLNVTSHSGAAGGLIGEAAVISGTQRGTEISSCYSTCSADGQTAAGGLVGYADHAKIDSSCYSVGLVKCADGGKKGAFAGETSGATVEYDDSQNLYSKYFSVINYGTPAVGTADGEAKIIALDRNTETYNEFIRTYTGPEITAKTAYPYDSTLVNEFKGKTYLPTVGQLHPEEDYTNGWPTYMQYHYGDWPSPETKVINSNKYIATAATSANAFGIPSGIYVGVIGYGEKANIPDGASLSMRELRKNSASYNEYVKGAAKTLGISEADAAKRMRFVDISIISGAREIQPASAVDVRLFISGFNGIGAKVVHFGKETELIDPENSEGVLSFSAESFSVYGVYQSEEDAALPQPKTPRVQFHYLSQEYTYSESENKYTAPEFEFINNANNIQTTQILQNGEALEMVSNPPNLTGANPKYFFGWYLVEMESVGADGKVTYTWDAEPEQIKPNVPVSITLESDMRITWKMGATERTSEEVIDKDGCVHVYLAPIYENYYFINFHLGARGSDIWNSIIFRKLVVLGNDDKATIRIGDREAPSTDATRQVFAGWETCNSEMVTEEVDGEMITFPKPVGRIHYFQSTDPVSRVELVGTSILSSGADDPDPEFTDGYYLVLEASDFASGSSVDLYPVFAEARYVHFNNGKSGNGATYVPSQHLLTSDLVQHGSYQSRYYAENLPSDPNLIPKRIGYRFMGWYADAALDPETGDITNLTTPANVEFRLSNGEVFTESLVARQVTDATGALVNTNFRKQVTDGGETKLLYEVHDGKLYVYDGLESLTLYAYWKEVEDTTITVNVWQQKISDSVYADDSEKTYDYVREYSYTIAVRSGWTLEQVRSNNKLYNGSTNVESLNATGFHHRTTTMSTRTVSGDGTTVVNVYHDRNVHTLTFRTGTGRNSKNNNSNVATSYAYTPATGSTGTQYAFIPGESGGQVVELINEGGVWKIPEYGYKYNENPEGGFVRVGDSYVPLTPVYGTTTKYTADYKYTASTSDNAQYVLNNGEYTEIERYRSGYYGDYTWYLKVGSANNGVSSDVTYTNGQTYYSRSEDRWGDVTYSQIYYRRNSWRTSNSNYGSAYTGDIYQSYTGTRYTRANDSETDVTDNATLNIAGGYYVDGNGGRVPVTSHEESYISGYKYDNNGVETVYSGEQRYSRDYEIIGSQVYNGDRYTRSGPTSGAHLVYEIKALYNQNISKFFPIPEFENGERWLPQNDSVWTEVLAYIDNMPDRDVSFVLDISNNSTKRLHYYVEALQGAENTVEYNGKRFIEYTTISANYGYFAEAEDYITIDGFSKSAAYPPRAYNSSGNAVSNIWSNQNAVDIYCYYLRNEYSLTYVVNYPNVAGLTFEGSGGESSDTYRTVLYEAPLNSYGSAFTPNAPDHYTFQGWYEDAACTVKFNFNSTMPAGDKIIYAGWRAVRFKINIDPNGGEIDHINHTYDNGSSDMTKKGYTNYWFDANGNAVAYRAGMDTTGWRPFATFNRAAIEDVREADSGYRTDQSTYFNGNYNAQVGRYDMDGRRQYVEISDAEADSLGTGNWFYYINTQAKPTDGSSIPSDLRNALYMTEAEVEQYYNFYHDWVLGNLQGGYITGTTLLGIDEWKDIYITKNANGGFQKYRKLNANETFTFLGWYKLDKDGNPESMPYNFSDPITEDMTLRAYWRLDGGYRIEYHPENRVHGVLINGEMDYWSDPQVANETYADSAKTSIYRQPTGITADMQPTEDYLFLGWQLVSAKQVGGNVIYTPIENGVYYDPGDDYTVYAGNADSDCIIHMQAVYQLKTESTRRPSVTGVILDANKAYYPGAGIDEDQGNLPIWDRTGSTSVDYGDDTITFSNIQANEAIHLYKYATTETYTDVNGRSVTGKNYFTDLEGFKLLGFNEIADPEVNDYIATYTADSVMSAPRLNSPTDPYSTVYAVWEPMVYLTFVNETDKAITFGFEEVAGSKATYLVNRATGEFTRITEGDIHNITIAPKGSEGDTLIYALPYGEGEKVRIAGTNRLGTGYILNVDSTLEGTPRRHSQAKNLEEFSFDETLVNHEEGIIVTFTAKKNDRTLILVDNTEGDGTGGRTEEFYYRDTDTVSDELPLRARVGYKFIGWDRDFRSTTAEYAVDSTISPLNDFFGDDETVTLYGIWEAQGEAKQLYVYKDVSSDGDREKQFTFEVRMNGIANPSGVSGNTGYDPTMQEMISGTPAVLTVTLAHEEYFLIIMEQTGSGDDPDSRAFAQATVQKYDKDGNEVGEAQVMRWESRYNKNGYVAPEITVVETSEERYDTSVEFAVKDEFKNDFNENAPRSVHWSNTANTGGTVIYHNVRKTADLIINKQLLNDPYNAAKAFEFTITLENSDGFKLSKSDYEITSGIPFEINGIPTGATVHITEKAYDDYETVSSVSAENTVTDLDPAGNALQFVIEENTTAEFTNTRKEHKIRIVKVGSDGNANVAAVFTLADDQTGGMIFERKYYPSELQSGVFTLASGSTYTLTEDAVLTKGYRNLESPVKIKVSGDSVTAEGDSLVTVSETPDANGVYTVTVTNLKAADITLTMLLNDIYDIGNLKSFGYNVTATYNGVALELEDPTPSLVNGQTVVYKTIPVGSVITLTQVADENYTTGSGSGSSRHTDTNDSQYVVSFTVEEDDTVTFTNTRRTAGLIVVKETEDIDDASVDYSFTISLRDTMNQPFPVAGITDNAGRVTFTLKTGEQYDAFNTTRLPLGTVVKVVEADSDDYDATITVSPHAQDMDTVEKSYTFRLGNENQVNTLTFTNRPAGINVNLKKVAGDGTTPVGGAQFTLYSDAACTSIVKLHGADAVETSSASGDVLFAKVKTGVYYMKETVTPAGYKDNSAAVYRMTVSKTGAVVELYENGAAVGRALDIIVNDVDSVRMIILKKISEDSFPLRDAKFALYRVDMKLIADNLVSSPNGVIYIDSLPYGVYYLKETVPPEGYSLPGANEYFKVTVTADGCTVDNELVTVLP